MNKLEFISCSKEHLLTLQTIGKSTFETAFGAQNDPSDLNAYLDHAFSEAMLLDALENDHSFFYLVQADQETIGYFKLNIETTQSEPIDNGLEIERIYILENFQGRGIGQSMMKQIFEIAQKLNKKTIWLGVWEKNYDAIRFYQRNGFKKFDEHDFLLGSDLQRDHLMCIYL